MTYQGQHSGQQLQQYIETGKLTTSQTQVVRYNPLAMEMAAKQLDRLYGG